MGVHRGPLEDDALGITDVIWVLVGIGQFLSIIADRRRPAYAILPTPRQ